MEWLKNLLKEKGLEESQINEIVEAYKAESPKHVVPKDVFNSTNNELSTAKETIAERDKQLKDLKGQAGDNEELRKKITELEKANKVADEKRDAELNRLKLENAIEVKILGAKAKNAKAVKALLDLDTIKLDENGEVLGLSEQLEGLQKSDAYLFGSDKPVGTPPPEGDSGPIEGFGESFAKQHNEQSGSGLNW